MTSPNDLMSEFQELKVESDEINENALNTTSTFGCSSEPNLFREMIGELKAMRLEMVEMKEKQDALQNEMLDELKIIRSEVSLIKKNAPEVHPDDKRPILEAIVGIWKLVHHENCEMYLGYDTKNHMFCDDLNVMVNGNDVFISHIGHQELSKHKIGRSNHHERVFIEGKRLKVWRYITVSVQPVHKTTHFIKDGQLHIKNVDIKKRVECLRIYDRYSWEEVSCDAVFAE